MAALAGIAFTLAVHAADPKPEASLNPADRGYVNPKLCFGCHTAIYKSYSRTGMARSFGRPSPQNTVEDYAVKNSFYHEPSRTYFQMIRRDGKYYQRWYQLDLDGKQTNASELSVDYVLGSAIHARAYIHREAGGRLFQLPVAWYAEKGGYWWMAPGYDAASQPYGRRPITYDCFFCHDSYPTVPGNHQKIGDEPIYTGDLPDGIDCQRCHGPGRNHIQRAATPGASVEDIRAAIVNPKRLPADREGEVCMQCHSQITGLRLPHAIKRYDRGDFGYQPGEPLGDFELQFTFAPGAQQNNWFQNVSTVARMRKSQCFIRSGGALKCTTCHDPHSADHAGDMAHYNGVCRQCHASAFDKLVAAGRHTAAAGCVDCHMPARRPMDVVHIVKHDHYIQRVKPAGDLTAAAQEWRETPENSYHGEVVPYYPNPLPDTAEDRMYAAVAQIRDRSNVTEGLARLKQVLEASRVARPEPYFELGEAWRYEGKPPNAIAMYNEALKRDPNLTAALLGVGASFRQMQQAEAAAGAFARATKAAPDSANAWNELGQTEIDAGRKESAKTALERAIAADPEMPQPHNGLGILLAQAGDSAGAGKEFREAMRLQPNLGDAHGNLANLLLARGDVRGAAYEYDIAVRLQPDDSLVRYNYGTMLNAMERYGDAERQFEEAIRVNPDFAEAHDLLGNLLERGGDLDRAMREYESAVRLSPKLAHAQLDLGATLLKRGDRAGATAHLKVAAASDDKVLRGIAEQLLKETGAP
jgi:tetratricopeptide (TPR) repeat protein